MTVVVLMNPLSPIWIGLLLVCVLGYGIVAVPDRIWARIPRRIWAALGLASLPLAYVVIIDGCNWIVCCVGLVCCVPGWTC